MDLITVFERFPNQEACIEYLESIRWGDEPQCPHCSSEEIARKAENKRVGRWNCHACKNSFNVLSGTIFQGTKIPLQKWFLGISLIINAKKSLSSYQLGRDLNLNQRSAWYLHMRIREAMVDKDAFLFGIVEADETYVGGKPRKKDKDSDDPPQARPRHEETPRHRRAGPRRQGGSGTLAQSHGQDAQGVPDPSRQSR